MKKTYIQPKSKVMFMQTEGLMALSLQSGTANGDDALVKDNDWDVFCEDMDEE